ncbi:MAG: phosphodiester glycosidase family protein [Bdellovibrionota bacterium]
MNKNFILLKICLCFLLLFSVDDLYAKDWFLLAPDLEMKEIPVKSNPIFGSNLLFIRTSLKNYQVKVIRAKEYGKKSMDVKSLALKSNAIIAINANFFDEYGKALGLVVNRGKVFNKMHRGGNTLTGVFQANRTNIKITGRNNVDYSSILEAVQAGPRLVANRAILETKNSFQNSKRSGVCVDTQNRLIIFSTMDTFSGVSLDDLKKILVSDEINCKDALNFDGGGSAQIYISNKIPNIVSNINARYVPGNDKIPVALGLFVSPL